MFGFLSSSMAIDIGSSHIRFAVERGSALREEASAIAIYQRGDGSTQVIATGQDALDMDGRAPPEIQVYYPIRDGQIKDFDKALLLLRHLMVEIQGRLLWLSPKVHLTIPHDANEATRKQYTRLLLGSGAKSVNLIDRAIASAVGAEIPIDEACGYMMVNLGGGVTETAVAALGEIVYYSRLQIGGGSLNHAIIQYLQKKYQLLISYFEAEHIKCTHGHAVFKRSNTATITVRGKDMVSQLPKQITIYQRELTRAMGPTIQLIANSIRSTIEKLPPELATDILRTGIVLLGAGAKLKVIDTALAMVTQHPVIIPDEPEWAPIFGAIE